MTISIEDVKRLRVNPGDVLVFRMADWSNARSYAPDCTKAIQEDLKKLFPDNSIIILDAECSVEVIEGDVRPDAIVGEGI